VSATPSFESCTGDVVKQIDLNAEVNQQTLDAAKGSNDRRGYRACAEGHGGSGRFLRNSRTVGSEFCEVTSTCGLAGAVHYLMCG
jgi:hypothetical protein